jgi:hypothetical protein
MRVDIIRVPIPEVSYQHTQRDQTRRGGVAGQGNDGNSASLRNSAGPAMTKADQEGDPRRNGLPFLVGFRKE